MAFSHGKTSAQFLGKYDVSSYLTELSAPARLRHRNHDVRERKQDIHRGPRRRHDFPVGFFDGSANAIDAIAADLAGDLDVPFTGVFGSLAIGSRCYLGQGNHHLVRAVIVSRGRQLDLR